VRHGRRVGLTVALVAVLLAASPPSASADREFTPRFAQNDAGDIHMAANTILTCRPEVTGCPDAQASARGARLGNNSWNMSYVDVDADPATFDSSSADLALPNAATVLFAGLYWGANTVAGTGGDDAPDAGARGRVLFDTPGAGGYTAVNADRVDEGEARSQRGAYQAYADVTAQVRAAGTYTVANVQSATGDDRYGGWALVVAYSAAGEPPRNLTVFDGFVSINSGDAPRELSVSGFRTPPSGPVRSRVGFVAYEGDLSLGGDGATLNGSALDDGKPRSSTSENFFNSTIWQLGAPFTAKAPNYDNQLGYDADIVDATGKISNGARSAAIRLQTTGDTYLPGVIFVATELYAPDLQSTKSVADLNGGPVEPGDELEYTIGGTNRGQDAAASVIVTDPVPAGTRFVPGSLVAGGARSDAADGDTAEFDAAAAQVTFRAGAGATATAGGRLAPGESYEVRYRARVAAGTPTGTAIVNQARVSLIAETLGFPISTPTNETRLTVSAPDLSMGKAFAGVVAPGEVVTYTLTVTNSGAAASRGEVVVTDPMPPTVSFGAPSGPGWSCVQTPDFEVTCRRSDPLAPGASYPPITLSGTVLAVPAGGLVNTSTVTGGGDVNDANNTATAAPPNAPLAALSIDKRVTPDTAVPGDTVTYVMTVANRGGFGPATGVQLDDPLPAGLTLESATALDQGTCSGAVTCSLGTLAGGTTARVRVVARVNRDTGPGVLGNTAVVNAVEPNASGDNTASASVRVRNTSELRLSKRLAASAQAGGPVRWTVTVANDGPGTMPGGSFNDVVPAVVNDPSAVVAGGSCTTAGRLLSCALPAIPSGGQAEIQVAGTLPDGAGGDPLSNGVQIAAQAFVPPPFPSTSTPPNEVALPAADVGVAKVGTPSPAARSGVVTYHVRATNHGPSTATGVTVVDRLPARVRFLGSTPARRCRAKGRVVTCRLGDLREGRSRSTDIRVRLRAGSRAGSVGNRISIDARQPDPAAANNRDRTRSRLAPRLVLRKSAAPRSAGVGETVSYRLRLTNRGPGTARGLRLCDRPGAGLALRRAPDARRRGRVACWRIRALRRGRSVTRRVVASVTKADGARRTNVATVRVGGTRAAAARVAVQVRGAPILGCPAALGSASAGPLAGPAC
jgi:uncharacterized repeat protein (TIGR01451 family)